MSPFLNRFPEIAARETRVVQLPYPQGGIPAGTYGFLELYCIDLKCDCRRVLLQVRPEDKPEKIMATINYGWEALDFYEKCLHGDREGAHEIRNASLDPLNAQSTYAPSLLRLFQTVVLQDKAYIERLGRHYKMFKEHLRRSIGGSDAPPSPDPRSA